MTRSAWITLVVTWSIIFYFVVMTFVKVFRIPQEKEEKGES